MLTDFPFPWGLQYCSSTLRNGRRSSNRDRRSERNGNRCESHHGGGAGGWIAEVPGSGSPRRHRSGTVGSAAGLVDTIAP